VIAVVPVRSGEAPAGGDEAVAEAGGVALLVGSGCAHALEHLPSAREVRVLEAGEYAPAAWASRLAGEVRDHDVVILPASPDGRDLAPRLAHEMKRRLHAGAMRITRDEVSLARWGGLVIEDVAVEPPFVATLQPGVRGGEPASSPPVIADSARTGTETAMPPVDARVLEVLPPDATTIDLAEAHRIVGGGAGLRSPERFAQLSAVAAAIGASMGATRVVTDRGWVSHQRQIGTTGVVVNPRLYLAFGISGAVQHTSGLGAPDHVVSVNTDPHCPMMHMADLAVVADANATLDALAARLGLGLGLGTGTGTGTEATSGA
jgi:electron transfer flavoprotein alpha subunit